MPRTQAKNMLDTATEKAVLYPPRGYMAFRPKDTKERIAHRLKIVSGQLKKVQAMVDEDAYCIDVIHQSQAIQRALKEIDNLTLEAHLGGCVTDAIVAGRKEEAVSEVMEVFKRQGT